MKVESYLCFKLEIDYVNFYLQVSSWDFCLIESILTFLVCSLVAISSCDNMKEIYEILVKSNLSSGTPSCGVLITSECYIFYLKRLTN
jgi:hypothetical protein